MCSHTGSGTRIVRKPDYGLRICRNCNRRTGWKKASERDSRPGDQCRGGTKRSVIFRSPKEQPSGVAHSRVLQKQWRSSGILTQLVTFIWGGIKLLSGIVRHLPATALFPHRGSGAGLDLLLCRHGEKSEKPGVKA